MKNYKLQAIFSEYLEWQQEDADSGRFWKAAGCFFIGITKLEALKSPSEKVQSFVSTCNKVATMLPEMEWSILPVISRMEPTIVCHKVLHYINAPASDRSMVSDLDNLFDCLAREAQLLGFPRLFFVFTAQELCLLRFFRHIERNLPIFPGGNIRLCHFLGISPRSSARFSSVNPFYDIFEEIRDALIQSNAQKIEQITLDIRSESGGNLSLQGKANAVTAHMLTAVMARQISPEVLLGTLPSHIVPPKTRRLTNEKVLSELKDFAESLETDIKIYQDALLSFHAFFSQGTAVNHSQYGRGIVIESNDDKLQVQFPGGETHCFLLLNALLDGQLFIDSLEFRNKLLFSSAVLKHGATLVQLLEDVNSRIQELESREVSKERLIELLPPWEDLRVFRMK